MDTAAASVASDPPARKSRRRWWAAFQVALGLALVVWLVSKLEIGTLVELARHGRPLDLVLGLGFLFAAFPVLQAARLHVLVARYSERFGTTFTINLIGSLFNNVLPSNVAGDGAKLFYLQRLKASDWGGPLAMLLLHRLSGVAVLHAAAITCIVIRHDAIIDAIAATTFLPAQTAGRGLAAAAGVAALAVLVVALVPAIRRRGVALARKLWGESWAAMRAISPRTLVWLFVLSVAFQAARAAGFVYLLAFVGESANPLDLVIAMAVTAVAAMLPITVGGLGVMEGALGMMLVAFGVSAPAAISVALAHRAVLLTNAAMGGLAYAAYGRRAR